MKAYAFTKGSTQTQKGKSNYSSISYLFTIRRDAEASSMRVELTFGEVAFRMHVPPAVDRLRSDCPLGKKTRTPDLQL